MLFIKYVRRDQFLQHVPVFDVGLKWKSNGENEQCIVVVIFANMRSHINFISFFLFSVGKRPEIIFKSFASEPDRNNKMVELDFPL